LQRGLLSPRGGKSYTHLLTGQAGKDELVKIQDQVAAAPS
jgi:hypothetical protein